MKIYKFPHVYISHWKKGVHGVQGGEKASGIRAEREAMSPSVTGEISTSEAPVETEIDEAFTPSVRLGFRRSFFCLRSRLDVGGSEWKRNIKRIS